MSRVALVACVYFGPLLLIWLGWLMRRWLADRRIRRERVPVAVLIARVEKERAAQVTNPLRPDLTSLPPSWCWPSRDPDCPNPSRVSTL